MAILVRCGCGRSFDFKSELAGRQVACPDSGGTVSIPAINEIYDVRDGRIVVVGGLVAGAAIGTVVMPALLRDTRAVAPGPEPA